MFHPFAQSIARADDLFDARGRDRNRQSFSQLPFEHIDPLTGNLLLTFTDLVLPGNAGFDLRIQRTYNSKIHLNYLGGQTTLREDSWAGIGWTLHLGRVFNASAVDLANPTIEMPDGSMHPTYAVPAPQSPSWCSPCFITREYWLYDKGDSRLHMTNGVEYTFGHSGSGFTGSTGARYATLIEDPFGNRIEATYRIATPTDALAQIIQRVGAQSRTITFSVLNGALSTMNYGSRSWQYQQADSLAGMTFSPFTVLTAVTPPAGPSWQFEYAGSGTVRYELLKVITPNGGTIDYTYRDNDFAVGTTYGVRARVVGTRTVGGRDVTSGLWTYSYPTGVSNQTTVSGPCVSMTYTFEGVGTNAGVVGAWKVGLPKTIVNQDETVTLTWQAGVAISSEPMIIGYNNDSSIKPPLLSQRVVTRGSRTYTTLNDYSTQNFNDYGRPNLINETGELSRSTSRTFTYNFTRYIKDKIASDTATVSSQAFARSWGYNLSGFTDIETVYGVQTTFSPDSYGNVASATNARSYQTSFDYSWGARSRIQTPQHLTTRTINADGTVDSETRRGFIWGFGYDTGGRLTSEDPPAGASTTIVYSGGTSITRSRSTSSVTEYLDGFGRTSATQDAVGILTDTSYDACGRAVYQSLPYTSSNTGTTYVSDALGRVIRATYPGGAFETFAYAGSDVTRTDEAGRPTVLRYRSFGDPTERRLTSVTDAAGVMTSYTWNTVGSLTEVSGTATGTRSWGYNPKNQLTSETHPESGATTYGRDAVGNMSSRTDAQNPATSYTYDGNDRLTIVDAPGSAYDTTISYDDADNRTGISNSYAAVTFVWDGANRLTRRTQVSGSESFVTDFGLDPDGNLRSIDYPSGANVTYVVDAMGRTTAATRNGTTVASLITYHPSGSITSFRSGDGTTHSLGFDNRHRPTSAVTTAGLNVAYTRNNVGNVTAIDDPRPGFGNSAFGYDPLDRMRTISGFGANTFTYDDAGNRLTKASPSAAYTIHPSTSRLMSISGAASEVASFGYDNNGNQSSHGASTFTYTPTNMLETATVAGAVSTYRYDGDDRRVLRITGGRSNRSVYGRGGELLGEFDVTGGVVRWTRDYVYAGGRLIAAATCDIQVSPSSVPFPQAGGVQTLTVAAQSNCAWQPTFVAPVPSWLTLSSTTERLGAGSVNVTATVNNTGAARTASIRLGTTVVQVNQQPSACTYAVWPLSVTANPAGETGTLNVTALAACGWTAVPQASWVSITSGASGSGTGAAAFSVAANPGTAPRSTTISVAGYSVAVNQAGAACVPTVSTTTLSTTSDAGSPTVTVTAATGCGWTGSSPVSWAQLRLPPGTASASVTGNGTANLAVDLQQNLSLTSRSAVLTIAGTSVTVTQAAFACTYTVSAPGAIPLAGGSVTVSVGAASICGWSVVDPAPPSWLGSVSPLSGTGNGTVTFTAGAGPNTGRSKAYTVAGQNVLVTQLGVPCTYVGTPAHSPWIVPGGGTSSVDIAVAAACPAGVTPVTSSGLPLTVTPIAGGISATYTLPPNTGLLPLTGTITMAGQLVHTAHQLGTSQPYQALEAPLSNAVLQSGNVTLSGYALDYAAQVGTGVVEVHVWVDNTFAGLATYGLYHAGVAAVLPAQFHYVGYTKNLTLTPGRHTITTYAYSNVSQTFNSTTAYPVDVNSAPAVTLTGPASGTLVNLGTVVSFTASASDADGDAVSVTYLANGAPFSPAVGPPFTFTAATALAGAFAITARATDARGGVTDSAPRTLVINAPPVVTITSPAQGTVLAAGQPFTVAATASDPDDTVQRVEFSYNGGIPMGTLYAPPYQLGAPSGVPAGTYTVTARAFDTRGLWTDSVPVTFTVTGGMEVRLGPLAPDGPWLAPRPRHGDPDGSDPASDTAVALLAHTLGARPTRTGRRRRLGAGAVRASTRLLRHGLVSLVVLLGLAAPATAQVTIEYYHLDPMGSVRMVTDASGDVTQRYDYQVFGEESSAGGQPRKYAGKERDPETGYDYFGGRYYANRLGRFTTVDPVQAVAANLQNPQLWNRYTYVLNNPLRYSDPDGRCIWDLCVGEIAAVVGISEGVVWAAAATATIAVPVWNHRGEIAQSVVDTARAAVAGASAAISWAKNDENGTIYRVPGSGTPSGRPYIGRHNKPEPQKTRANTDGRDRTKARVVDTYDTARPMDGRVKEQRAIDGAGGVPKLDNKRNEIKKPTP